ncbi:hypothetical protein V8E53_009088 [Lactarius tabidus]
MNIRAFSRVVKSIKAFLLGPKGRARQLRNTDTFHSRGRVPLSRRKECGVPMNMNARAVFRSDDHGLSVPHPHFTPNLITLGRLWNYNPDNDDTHDWSSESFSWFSNSRVCPSALSQDARLLDAVRSYATKTAGVPLHFEYEMASGAFTY